MFSKEYLTKVSKDKALLSEHFASTESKKGGTIAPKDVKLMLSDSMYYFASQIDSARKGGNEKDGSELPAKDVSFNDATKLFYGCTKDEYLKSLGIHTGVDTLASAAKKMGYKGGVDKGAVYSMVNNYNSLDFSSTTHNTNDFRQYRFVIPELILDIVRVNYLHSARWPSWTKANTFVGVIGSIKVPHAKEGDLPLSEISEGADIPFGVVEFDDKEVSTKKYGVGIRFTDELIQQTPLDMLGLALQQINSNLNIGEDNRAVFTLINGEQAGNTESAPAIGVETIASGIQHQDMDNVTKQMGFFGRTPNRLIANKTECIRDLNESKPERDRETVEQYFDGETDLWALATGRMIYLDSNSAMARLQYGAMTMETRRNPQNQTEEMFISFRSGFYILERGARVVQDNTVDVATTPWPDFMNYENYINNGTFLDY